MKNFCPVFHGRSSLRKFSKKSKKIKIPKRPKIVPKSIQTSSERVLRQFFRKTFAQFSMEGRVFENFQKKNKEFSKFQKSRKSLPKVSKRVLNLFWGNFFQKKNCYPSVPWRLESSKTFKKIKNISKFQKCPKSFPKASKRVLNVFWGEFFEKFFAQCSMDGRVFKNFRKNQKNIKIPKMPKIVPKSIQTWFEQVLGQVFRKIFAQFSMECRVFEIFQKKSKKLQKSHQKRTKPFQRNPKVF